MKLKLSIPRTRLQASEVMEYLLSGKAEFNEIVNYLQERPVDDAKPEELLGYRDVLWQKRRRANFGRVDLDIVGTGGVRRPRYNVSTTVAFIAAACGVRVAKHGNRGSVKPNGSCDLLEVLGMSLPALTAGAVDNLQSTGLTFLFARDWHPSFGLLASARAEVGSPTVFNLLGPLLNPSQPAYQMVGCGDPAIAHILAVTLSELGAQALVVTGSDGLDEITTAGSSQLIEVKAGKISTTEILPEDFGIQSVQPLDLAGGNATTNATEFLAILCGQGRKSLVELVTLNAAFALSLVESYSVEQAVSNVRTALAQGTVETFFRNFRKAVMAAEKVAR